ncbi:TonB-dependent receptor domain-containing protein [Neolewinella xylanilytica]|nr:TonB-dependent receptor [Neolewinella xylanilytica]
MRRTICFLAVCLLLCGRLAAQVTLEGSILDANNGDPLIGASVLVKNTTTGTVTDLDGNWELTVSGLPAILQFSYLGYAPTEVEVTDADQELTIRLGDDAVTTEVVEVRGRRISEKQQQAALTVETLDAIAIKETAAANFYDGLGSLKDVDLTAASLGFKIVNTRGFNSTNPVRSLQIIDGVDNQSPGLNFSLGNFLGASELDVNRVNLVVGASSAFYGPNAFNGVIAIETKDPFLQQGLSAQIKVAERNLIEGGVRWAQAINNEEGQPWFAYKLNLFGFRADDWVADNYDAVYDSPASADNPGGYDAVNVYGDEYASALDFQRSSIPGIGIVHRRGYKEIDLVDYDSENLKAGAAFHFRLNPRKTLESSELILASNYSTGTTVYQGDNRFSLRGIQFFQHRIELRNRDDFFIRAYVTHEDAGESYDPYFTALRLQNRAAPLEQWQSPYINYWQGSVQSRFTGRDDYPRSIDYIGDPDGLRSARNQFFSQEEIQQILVEGHDEAQAFANTGDPFFNTQDFYEPGSERFEQAFDDITGRLPTDGGTRFFDKSALYHAHGEKQWQSVLPESSQNELSLTVGANGRRYTPNSRGSILLDTMGRKITNWEVGAYGGGTFTLNSRYRLSASLRADKNENFDLLFSPAASAVYTPNERTTFRLSFSSAIRNPTLADQYLFYNVGRAILIGNLGGFNDLVTIESLREAINAQNLDLLERFDVAPIRPERVRTLETGVRTTLFEKLYVDATYYYSFYNDFIGFNLGADASFDPTTNLPSRIQAYRVSANATDQVTTQGFSIGSNLYFANYFVLNGNYSFNRLNTASDDPIIPAFNTPEHKYNIGVSGRNVPLKLGAAVEDFGFNVTYKWIDGFLFEGSPQFTGFIESYGMLDAQVNVEIKPIHTIIKIGASNLLDNRVFQVYGGPRIGRLAYISATYNWQKR